MSDPDLDKLICPCCQELVAWVDDHRTPHFDRATETFSCTQHPDVANPLTGHRISDGYKTPEQMAAEAAKYLEEHGDGE